MTRRPSLADWLDVARDHVTAICVAGAMLAALGAALVYGARNPPEKHLVKWECMSGGYQRGGGILIVKPPECRR